MKLYLIMFFFLTSCQTNLKLKEEGLAEAYFNDHLYQEASEHFLKALELGSKNPLIEKKLGITYIKLDQYDEGIKHLNSYFSFNLEDDEAHFQMGEALRAKTEYAKAIYHYERSLQLLPKKIETINALAWSYYKIRYYEEALKLVQNTIETKLSNEHTSIIYLRLLIKLKEAKLALKHLEKIDIEKIKELKPYFLSLKADALQELLQDEEALKLYDESLILAPLLASSLLGRAKCLIRLKQVDNAISALEKAIRISKDLTEAYFLVARLYEKKNPKKALSYYDKFRKMVSKDPEFLSMLSKVDKKMAILQGN